MLVIAACLSLMPQTELVSSSTVAVRRSESHVSVLSQLSVSSQGGQLAGKCHTTMLVQRLRGGVLMGDTSFDMYDSDSEDPSMQTEAYRPYTEPVGFKSNVVSDHGPVPFQPHPDTLRPQKREVSPEDVDLMQQAKEAVRIPMGGGAAVLTPILAKRLSTMARAVFKQEISPVLHRTGSAATRFAAVVSPFRMPDISSLVAAATPLVLGSPRRSLSFADSSDAADCNAPPNTSPTSHSPLHHADAHARDAHTLPADIQQHSSARDAREIAAPPGQCQPAANTLRAAAGRGQHDAAQTAA